MTDNTFLTMGDNTPSFDAPLATAEEIKCALEEMKSIAEEVQRDKVAWIKAAIRFGLCVVPTSVCNEITVHVPLEIYKTASRELEQDQ